MGIKIACGDILMDVREKKHMQFNETKTYQNLARAFAGESQAGMRYQFSAQLAMQQGYKILSDVIRAIAKNETNHAKAAFDYMLQKGGSVDNVEIRAGYPFHAGDLIENLRLAAQDEREEEERIYPEFARIAREEGFNDIAGTFERIAAIEGNHKTVFSYLYDGLKNGTLYKRDQPALWVCSECGYMHTAKEAWNVCPVCKQSQGYVELHIPFQKEKVL